MTLDTSNELQSHVAACKAGIEHRREPRFPCEQPIRFTVRGDAEPQFAAATMTDFSMSGIGLVTDHHLTAGQLILVVMPRRDDLLQYVVRHCRRRADGQYQVGAEWSGVVEPRRVA